MIDYSNNQCKVFFTIFFLLFPSKLLYVTVFFWFVPYIQRRIFFFLWGKFFLIFFFCFLTETFEIVSSIYNRKWMSLQTANTPKTINARSIEVYSASRTFPDGAGAVVLWCLCWIFENNAMVLKRCGLLSWYECDWMSAKILQCFPYNDTLKDMFFLLFLVDILLIFVCSVDTTRSFRFPFCFLIFVFVFWLLPFLQAKSID